MIVELTLIGIEFGAVWGKEKMGATLGFFSQKVVVLAVHKIQTTNSNFTEP